MLSSKVRSLMYTRDHLVWECGKGRGAYEGEGGEGAPPQACCNIRSCLAIPYLLET